VQSTDSTTHLADAFGPFDGRVWLNAAHQGPLPRKARAALERIASEKAAPHLISDESFWEVPAALKTKLAPLIGASAEEIILGNSTTYGLHLLAQGIRWRDGDEILLVQGDFPATVVPWLWLRERGVSVRLIEPRSRPLDPAQLADEISPRTRLFCSSWVFSLTGEAIDIGELGMACRARDVLFVLNGTQGVGARTIDVHDSPLDALVGCGFKWLCGPYGTGFCWIDPSLLSQLDYHQDYWLAQLHRGDLAGEAAYELDAGLGAGRYDVFGTANFFNFVPWTAALEVLEEVGIDAIAAHDQHLIDVIAEELAGARRLRLLSPANGPARSTIAVITHADPARNEQLHRALRDSRIDAALRARNLRLSPHLYNDEAQLRTALRILISDA
jgi:cysteine desulfurase / selenocysteine lyase